MTKMRVMVAGGDPIELTLHDCWDKRGEGQKANKGRQTMVDKKEKPAD